MVSLTGHSDISSVSELESLATTGENLIDTSSEEQEVEAMTMQQFMTEQRAVIYSDLQQHRLTHAHSQAMIERLTDSLNLIDDWFIEQAQPVEPGQEVQS